jgi:Autotransporter beta-domain./Chlamydia polymorphic membrane protein middle domain.
MTSRILPLSLILISLSWRLHFLQANETNTLKFKNFTFFDRDIEFIVAPPNFATAQNITYANVSNRGGNFTISGCTQDQWFSRGLSTTASGGAFVEPMTSFTAINNANLFFCNNYCTYQNGGGAIHANGTINFENNQNVLFYNNTTIGVQFTGAALRTERNCGGALYATRVELINNHSLNFINNTSGDMGGAISATQNIIIKNTPGTITFENNHTTDHIPNTNAHILARGGAIASSNCEISNNSGPIVFNHNYGSYGGAITTGDQCTFRDNKGKIIFTNNHAIGWHNTVSEADGAALRIGGMLTFRNNTGPIYFESNEASYFGGVFSSSGFNFQENGPIYFLNNSAASGAVIRIHGHTSGANYIHTGTGDIIFNNNTEFSSNSISAGLRKIFSIPSVRLNTPLTLSIGAKKNTGVYFYDLFQWGGITKTNTPIENSPHIVTINPSDQFSGAVVFSYKHMPSDHLYRMITSKTHNFIKDSPTTLKFGTMSIEEGAEFEVFNVPFTQERTSLLALGGNATLTVGKGASLTITNLGIILPDIFDKDNAPPCIRVNPQDMTQNTSANETPISTENIATQMIFFSGPLSLVDENYESVYDSFDLSQGKSEQPILHIETTNDQQLSSDWKNTLNTLLYSLPHYGYQGLWTPTWTTSTRTVSLTNDTTLIDTTNTSIQEQKATSETFDSNSTITAKIPSIRASTGGTTPTTTTEVMITRHSLVVNWAPVGYVADPARRGDLIADNLVHSGRNTTMYLRSLLPDDSHFSLQGSAATLFTKQQKRLDYHGYSSASKGYIVASQVSGAYGHKFSLSFSQTSNTMKEKITNNRISSHYYLSALCFEQPMFDRIALIGAAAYNYGTHKMRSFYGDTKSSKGEFHSTTLGGSLRCELRNSARRSIALTPFIQGLFSRTEPASIQETGDLSRLFSLEQAHTSVVAPIGIKGMYSQKWPTVSWEMELAYQPTLYWKRPLLNALLIKNNGSWIATNTPIAKHSFYGRGSHFLKFSCLKLFANYQAEVATSTVSHYINAGGALVF